MLNVNAKKLAERVGRNLARCRAECNLSLQALARATGLRWSDLEQAERGNRQLLLTEMVLLARALGMRPDAMLVDCSGAVSDVRPLA